MFAIVAAIVFAIGCVLAVMGELGSPHTVATLFLGLAFYCLHHAYPIPLRQPRQ
jgi:4-amino-4-deoxy-L-arabinose transferase-like glycosyltransferase